ncbi:MAG: epoxyqueuosine reductase QueH [Thermodesulfobacteriota bacterium]
MKLLLHTCCGPCSIYPLGVLRAEGFAVMGFFYRHNIHPFQECLKREETLRGYARQVELSVIYQEGYDLEGFIRTMAFRETERCRLCYHERLGAAARIAKKGRFDCFSSTLLYSRFQQHDLVRAVGEAVAGEVGIPFHYSDFRRGWKEGVAESKRLNMYRQQYCGCIYSEKERFYREKTESPANKQDSR